MAKTITITPGSCTNYLGSTTLSDDTVYLRSDNYALRLKLEIPQRLSELRVSVGFRANVGNLPGGGTFYAGLTQSSGSTPPDGVTTFQFDSDSNRKGSFVITKKLKAGTWYLWIWEKTGGTADVLSGRKSQGYPTWSLSGATDPAGHVYRNGTWEDAVPKVYRNGVWRDAVAKKYDGKWGDLA